MCVPLSRPPLALPLGGGRLRLVWRMRMARGPCWAVRGRISPRDQVFVSAPWLVMGRVPYRLVPWGVGRSLWDGCMCIMFSLPGFV